MGLKHLDLDEELIRSYSSSKELIDLLKGDKKFCSLAQKLCVYRMSGKDFEKIYEKDYLSMDKYLGSWDAFAVSLDSIIIEVIPTCGTLAYSSSLSIEEAKLEENFNTQPDVNAAISYASGNPIIVKDSIYPEEIVDMISAGYQISSLTQAVLDIDNNDSLLTPDIIQENSFTEITTHVSYTISNFIQDSRMDRAYARLPLSALPSSAHARAFPNEGDDDYVFNSVLFTIRVSKCNTESRSCRVFTHSHI